MTATETAYPLYWNNEGKYQSESDRLNSLVPDEGCCDNTFIDLYRAASNLYYERFNNGNCNRRVEDRRAVCQNRKALFAHAWY